MTDTEALTYFNQAGAFLRHGQFDDALAALTASINAKPHYPEAHFNLGKLLLITGGAAEAIPAFERAVKQLPSYVDARYELANAYRDSYRFRDAEREMREVIRQQPNHALPLSALGLILVESAQLDDALPLFADAMSVDPDGSNASSNWVNTQQYVPGVSERSLAESHAFQVSLHPPVTVLEPFMNAPVVDRRLRVGFVSPDLAEHPVGRLSVGLFENLKNFNVEPIVFSTRPQTYEDQLSKRVARTTSWRRVFGISDDALALLIRRSQVDVLIDMSGHTANHRLKVFARRAAPIQVGWLGYPSTTGLANMDYVLANHQLTPPGTETHYAEDIIRMPCWHACFEAPSDAPPIAPLPAIENGFITFGCFNNPAKMNDDVISSFARILSRVPGSRIRLQYKSLRDADLQARFRAKFLANGIASDRIDIIGYLPEAEFLASYNKIDIALDTFPYSGCMTTCDATWMGCPVITFPGATFAGRQAASYLTVAGLSALVARDKSHYEDIAVELASNTDKLALQRLGLRAQIAASPVCDSAAFAHDFAKAMRDIWSVWCAKAVV